MSRWLWARRYAKHLAIAWPGISLFGLVTAASFHFRAWELLFDFPGSGPFFAGYILVGLMAGYFFVRRDGSRAALWVWVPALALFVNDIHFQLHVIVGGGWHGVWTDYFSNSQCGGSECANELVLTAPLYATVAYALGAIAALWRGRAAAP